MSIKFTVILFTMCLNSAVSGQYAEKIWLDKSDPVYGYYTLIKPSSGRVQGALILLDGFGGNADGFMAETRIHNVAWANDIVTVGVPTNTSMYADQTMIKLLNQVSTTLIATYGLRKDQFAIGGMSSGGTIALRYAELCKERPAQFPIEPNAVFVIDSPVDLIGLYELSEKEIKKNYAGWWINESKMIIDRFRKELGDKKTDVNRYNEVSPFWKDKDGVGNEQYLKEVAVRTYHDADVSWFIQNRRRSLYETNMLNASELINRLVLMGNNQAEFMISKVPGKRSDGTRHPHSWNVVDEIELVQWIKEKLHFYPEHIAVKYDYPAPQKWARELIMFPMNFAPTITYKGFEELRFAPGWSNAASNEQWAYSILWWLDGKINFSEKNLKDDLEAYYSGLTKNKALADKLDMNLYKPASVEVKKSNTATGDKATYTATARIFDSYVNNKPLTLYFKIHIKDCPQTDKTIVLIEAAAGSYNDPVWQSLDQINKEFKCSL